MNNLKPNISVIMPVYNADKYIDQAIRSIVSQTYKNFEFLILDDASTDETVKIIESFNDSRIRLLKNDYRSGITQTLNRGIEESKYELIARMDADDIAHPWRFEKQVNYLLEHPDCALLASHVDIIDEKGRFIRTEGLSSEYLYYSLNFECCIFHPTIIFRKSAILNIGSYELPYAEDYDLFWRVAQRSIIASIEEPLLCYRQHENNTSQVSKKMEYDEYTFKTILRNIRYYTGPDMDLKISYIECYRNNFSLLLKDFDVAEIINCIQTLQLISVEIMATENPNRNHVSLKYIIDFKRNYIISEILKLLPFSKAMQLIRKRKELSLHPRTIYEWIKHTVKKQLQFG